MQIEIGDTATPYEPYCGGSPNRIEIDNCKGGYFSTLPDYGLRVEGATLQDGTPTPDNPVPIRCVKAGTKIRCCGKNLLNVVGADTTRYGVRIVCDENAQTISMVGTCSNINIPYQFRDVDLPVGTYTLSAKNVYGQVSGNVSTIQGWYIDASGKTGNIVFSQIVVRNNEHRTFTLTEPCTIRIRLIIYEGYDYNVTYSLLFEKNSVQTNYVPYVCNEIAAPCDLFEGDTWYPMTGKVKHIWHVRTPLATEYCTKWDATSVMMLPSHDGTEKYHYDSAATYLGGKCNVCAMSGTAPIRVALSMGGNVIYITTPDTTSVESWRAYLTAMQNANTPVMMILRLKVPIIEHYPPQPIFAPAGTVNVLQSPTDLPARLSATMMVRR